MERLCLVVPLLHFSRVVRGGRTSRIPETWPRHELEPDHIKTSLNLYNVIHLLRYYQGN